MTNAESEMLNSLFSSFKQYLYALDARIAKLEELRSLLPDDDFMSSFEEQVTTVVDRAIETYDLLHNDSFKDAVKEVVEDLGMSVEDQIRDFIEDKVSVELNVSRY